MTCSVLYRAGTVTRLSGYLFNVMCRNQTCEIKIAIKWQLDKCLAPFYQLFGFVECRTINKNTNNACINIYCS